MKDRCVSHVLSRAEREAFLADVRVATIAITAPDRAPLCVPIWYAYAPGGDIGLWMDGDSYKVKCLRRAGRLTLCVQDTTRPYRYVSVEGEVESITPIDWARELEPLVARYLGAADARTYLDGFGGPAGVRGDVYVRVRPTRWRAEQL